MIKKLTLLVLFFTATLVFSSKAESNTNKPASPEKVVASIAEPVSEEDEIAAMYDSFALANENVPSLISFTNGITGYNKLVEEGKIKNELLTIVDFSLPSTEKRMWVLDMSNNKVLYHTHVSHGRNTGGNMASKFSNIQNSNQSSLGFYVTDGTYFGKNGLSLYLDGMEKGFNSNARDRYVVIHGADYANPGFISKAGRLGRSLGCPALPTAVSKEIIHKIKGKSALFIYHPNKDYAKKSTYLNPPVV